MRDIRGRTVGLDSIERTDDVRCCDEEPARDADGRIRMNTDDLAARTIDAAKNVLRQQLEAQADQRAMAALVEKLAAQATIQQ